MAHFDKRFNRTLAIAIAGALASAAPAMTHAQATTDTELEEIVVTGSSIKRIEAEGALPVQVFDSEAIARSGATQVSDFVQSIPAMQGFTGIVDSVGGTGGGVTTASIHDVGSQYTLVLLNSRRVAPADSGTTIDLNSIPLVAIERIEVLTDGASALYGADAIAGVVNFILKSGEAPLQLSARYSYPEHQGGEEYNFSISKGWGDLQDTGYEVFLAASYDNLDHLAAKDRSFASTGIISGRQGKQIYDFFNGSSRSVPPNVDVFYEDFDKSVSFSPYREDTGVCPPDHVAIGRQCFFDYTSTVEIAPEIERSAVYGTGKLALGDSGWSLFADAAYTDVSTIARIAPYPAEFVMGSDHPYYSEYVLPYLTPGQAASVDLVNVKYRLYDVGNRTYDYSTKATHLVGGATGEVGGFDMSAAVTWSQSDQNQNYLAGFPLADEFNAGLNGLEFDPFPYPLGTMPPDQLEALRSTQYKGNYNSNKIEMLGFDFNVQHGLFDMGGGQSILSVGADYRDTSYSQKANQNVANAEILFDDVQAEFDLARDNWGAYAEFLAPVMDNLEFTAAVRYDSISGVTDDMNNQKVGDTEDQVTYKIGGKWQIIPSVAVRASYGTGFRAATMREIAGPLIDFGVTSGTYNCPFSSSFDPLGYYAAGYVCADGLQYEVFQGGNPDLKPETSAQWNVGVIWQPTNSFSAGLNYWSVEIEDGVSSVSERLILENAATYLDLYTTKYKQSNGLTYVAIIDAPINIGKIQNEGLDWDLTYTTDLGTGQFTGRLAGTYLNKSRYTVPGTDDVWTTSLDEFGVNDAVSLKNIVYAEATYSHEYDYGSFEHSLLFNFKNGYKDQAYSEDDCVFLTEAGDCTAGRLDVPEYYTFDWRTSWRPMEHVKVLFAIDNLFDEEPPLSLRVNGAGHQLGYDPRYADAYGRTYALTMTLEF